MPRPNPPRKRPRRRPPANARAARADAALTKQTADSTQQKSLERDPSPAQKRAGAAGATAAAAEEPWTRRSIAILLGTIAVTQVFIGVLLWTFAPPPKDLLGLVGAVLGLNVLTLLAACLLAAPVAKRISGEHRSLRIVETLGVGVVLYFLYLVLATAAGFVLTGFSPATTGPGGSCSGTTASGAPTALPNGTFTPSSSSSGSSSVSATPCPSPSPSPARTGGASPSASASASSPGTTTSSLSATEVYTAFAVIDVIAFVGTIYIYPPLYKRLRFRPPPRSAPPKDKTK